MSKADETSSKSICRRIWSVKLTRSVSTLWLLLYADWWLSSMMLSDRCSVNLEKAAHHSITLERRGKGANWHQSVALQWVDVRARLLQYRSNICVFRSIGESSTSNAGNYYVGNGWNHDWLTFFKQMSRHWIKAVRLCGRFVDDHPNLIERDWP